MRHARFYVLVTACILARKYEWLRDACLAAVLLLPAVAALHGIVLAAVHDDGEPPLWMAVSPWLTSQVPSIWTCMELSNYAQLEFLPLP